MANILHLKILPLIARLYIKKVNGKENISKNNKGFIVAANHASYIDHFILGGTIILSSGRMAYFLAKKEHFEGLQRKWHEFLHAIPIDRQAGGKSGLKMALKALKHGKIIVIYPEGTRTLTGKLQKAKTGVARLALAAKVPVLPVGLVGTFEILPKGIYIPRFKKATVNIGKLMYFDGFYGKENNKKALRLVTTKIMKKIAKLAKQKYNY
ncbi:MAG: 1-acyl-sn-glycerol-3-phosphate acyltransferase [Candidatus Nomurabacteria bacterium GW2011_GWA2_40_9]|uniref:1-acyl-sn-glycerol-3-phosphate acyltransferase n=1 Tax=Candidatus Nomurabacteria bacterium GW2011_GWA2_40_9 TaxID=1618734 RepID=A0A0G0W2K6_9BACT|nr:MAG: 1-acyl-sn-glycerol-3-phosphate acyltransferase [Candidatus Nomurabacteria bacterium GW2011_GWA2_40_9]